MLEKGGGAGCFSGGVGAGAVNPGGAFRAKDGRCPRTGADALHQRRHGGSVAEPRAVVDIVGAEAGAHELLDRRRFSVRAVGGAEAGKPLAAMLVADALQPLCGAVERLVPARLAEMRPRVGRVELVMRVLGHAVLADHRHGQTVRMAHIVEAEASLDAQPILVRRSVPAIDIEQLVVLDVVGELAADAAIRADAVDGAGGLGGEDVVLVDQRGRHERASRAGLHALAAGDAGALAHRIVEIEHDLLAMAAPGHADDIVDLHFAAGANAEIALDAGVEVDRHRRVAAIGLGLRPRGEAALLDADAIGPAPEAGVRIMRGLALRLVADQQLEHHLAREFGALGSGLDLHAGGRLADAGRRGHALALDLDHAGAAIAVGAIARRRAVAEMRNLGAAPLRRLPDGLARQRLDLDAVEVEFDRVAHHAGAVAHGTSSGKCFITILTGFIAAWPSPQIEASLITLVNSSISGLSQRFACISFPAFSVPTRDCVHSPQLSSSKNRTRASAKSFMSSLPEITTPPADPMKQPLASIVPQPSS